MYTISDFVLHCVAQYHATNLESIVYICIHINRIPTYVYISIVYICVLRYI
jgi:hypothetical protein